MRNDEDRDPEVVSGVVHGRKKAPVIENTRQEVVGGADLEAEIEDKDDRGHQKNIDENPVLVPVRRVNLNQQFKKS